MGFFAGTHARFWMWQRFLTFLSVAWQWKTQNEILDDVTIAFLRLPCLQSQNSPRVVLGQFCTVVSLAFISPVWQKQAEQKRRRPSSFGGVGCEIVNLFHTNKLWVEEQMSGNDDGVTKEHGGVTQWLILPKGSIPHQREILCKYLKKWFTVQSNWQLNVSQQES